MPFLWDTAYYCLDLSAGIVRHFPEGTYKEQVATNTGRVELNMLEVVWRAWRTFYSPISKWGDMERRVAGSIMPEPPKPTRRLDDLIMSLWPGSYWTHALTRKLRGIDG